MIALQRRQPRVEVPRAAAQHPLGKPRQPAKPPARPQRHHVGPGLRGLGLAQERDRHLRRRAQRVRVLAHPPVVVCDAPPRRLQPLPHLLRPHPQRRRRPHHRPHAVVPAVVGGGDGGHDGVMQLDPGRQLPQQHRRLAPQDARAARLGARQLLRRAEQQAPAQQVLGRLGAPPPVDLRPALPHARAAQHQRLGSHAAVGGGLAGVEGLDAGRQLGAVGLGPLRPHPAEEVGHLPVPVPPHLVVAQVVRLRRLPELPMVPAGGA